MEWACLVFFVLFRARRCCAIRKKDGYGEELSEDTQTALIPKRGEPIAVGGNLF